METTKLASDADFMDMALAIVARTTFNTPVHHACLSPCGETVYVDTDDSNWLVYRDGSIELLELKEESASIF